MANRNILNTRTVQGNLSVSSIDPASISLKAVDKVAVDKVAAKSTMTIPQKAQESTNQLDNNLFGFYLGLVATYPNDIVRLDVENNNNQYIESDYRVNTYTKTGTEITLNPELDLSNLGYLSGRYKVTYRFHRNLLGAGDAHRLQVQEISPDGTEVRVVPVLSTQYDNGSFLAAFSQNLFEIPKSQTLTNLFLFKDATTALRVFDYVQDKFTYPSDPYSIIFKLNSPTSDVVVGDLLWLSQQVNDDLVDTITISPPKAGSKKTLIAGPDWDVLRKSNTTTTTQYKDWDDLLSTNTQTSQGIVAGLLSSSLLEGINLNVDYKSFENHVHFGSAVEKLLNFKYKMELLAGYDAKISALSSGITGLLSGSASSSIYYQSNVLDAQNKKTALLGSFDGYERYLYYQSSSYVTNSYGEFYPSTWPKSNSTYPYVNYSYTSSQVEDWFDGIIASASVYDQNNNNALYKLVPAHVLEDSANEGYVLFTHMIGHYFDLVYGYIKAITVTSNRDQSISEGFSKDLIYNIAKNLGIDFENGTTLDELWNYTLGTDSTGSLSTSYGTTTEDKTKEIWKRIINNLPYLLKTKGTERGVRALINCFGIPRTILRIREFGGAEPDFDTKTDYVYERFSYDTIVGYNGGYYQMIQLPWETDPKVGLVPMTIEARVKMAPNQTKTQRLIEKPDSWYIEASKSGSNQYLTFYLGDNQNHPTGRYVSSNYRSAVVSCSIYDGLWHHITLQRSVASDDVATNQAYTLTIRNTNYEKVTDIFSASLNINGTTQQHYNRSFATIDAHPTTADKSLWMAKSGSTSQYVWTGSIQEFRYWNTSLQSSIVDNHALAPTSFQGNLSNTYTGSTSSFDTLWFRLPLGSDTNKIATSTTTLSSAHPDQRYSKQATLFGFDQDIDFNNPVIETYSLEWPDIGSNRSISNKIRIDETFVAGNSQLRKDSSVVRSLLDNYPIDNPRLGIYLSPTDEVNEDIAEQFGGLSIDDYIGSPSDLSNDYYTDLNSLKREYFKKYTGRNKTQNYIRLIKHYDAALFQLIKKLVPHRANTQVGLVVEPHILDRNKIATKLPTFESEYYTSSISLPEIYIPGGFVQDADGEPFRDSPGYVDEAVIGNEPFVTLPEQDYDMVVLDGTAISAPGTLVNSTVNEFSGVGVDDNPSTSGSMAGTVELGVSAYGRNTRYRGSQYVFTSYYKSGSGASEQWLGYTSSRYDYYDPINPAILDNIPSAVSNVSNNIYDVDIFGGKAFSNPSYFTSTAHSGSLFAYTETTMSSVGYNLTRWTADYGLRFAPSVSASGTTYSSSADGTNCYWQLVGPSYFTGSVRFPGLSFRVETGLKYTGSAYIPAFFYNIKDPKSVDYIYKVSVTVAENSLPPAGSGTSDPVSNRLTLYFGYLDCPLTASITPVSASTEYIYTTKALGNYLGLRIAANGAGGSGPSATYISSLKVECLNYRAQVQDYHLRDSYGMRTARYDGSKLTSADWNVDSPDTIDKGPVVVVTTGGGKQLSVNPNTRGTFQIK